MPTMLTSLGLDKLSRDERLALVQELWDSIAAESGPSLLSDCATRRAACAASPRMMQIRTMSFPGSK